MNRKLFLMLVLFLGLAVGVSVDSFKFKDLKNVFSKKNLRKVAHTTAVAAVVRKMSGQLNSFINGLLLNNGVGVKQTTKVVPLISGGKRLAVGGAQVSGPEYLLEKVHAVFQLDGDLHKGKFRIKAYVPTTSSTKLDRVNGVGVTAIIDYHVR